MTSAKQAVLHKCGDKNGQESQQEQNDDTTVIELLPASQYDEKPSGYNIKYKRLSLDPPILHHIHITW